MSCTSANLEPRDFDQDEELFDPGRIRRPMAPLGEMPETVSQEVEIVREGDGYPERALVSVGSREDPTRRERKEAGRKELAVEVDRYPRPRVKGHGRPIASTGTHPVPCPTEALHRLLVTPRGHEEVNVAKRAA